MEPTSSLVMQKNIKNNSEELQDFLRDLNNWEKDIKLVDEKLAGEAKEGTTEVPPVRCKKKLQISPSKKTTDAVNKHAVDKMESEKNTDKERIKSYDYAAWDKFDVDKALESSEEEEDASTTTNTAAKRLSKEERAAALKEEGNKCYSSGELDNAIAKYTQAIALDPSNPILPANRAMAYIKIKKYIAAEADCNKCLKLDPKYIKAYLRRGTARINLEKLEAAREDFSKVLELEPWNKEAKREMEKLNKFLSQNKKDSSQMAEGGSTKNADSHSAQPEQTTLITESKKLSKNSSECQEIKTSTKKLKIEEVNSASQEAISPDSEVVLPIEKPPHLRSLKPLKRIAVKDVPTQQAIRKQSEKVVNKQEKNSIPEKKPHTFKGEESQKAEKSSPLNVLPKPPKTSHQFSQDWSRLSSQLPQAIKYLKTIPPSFFSNVDLETETFVHVLKALASETVTPSETTSYLAALAKSSEFSVHVMFFDDDQKEVLSALLAKCKTVEGSAGDVKEIEKVLQA